VAACVMSALADSGSGRVHVYYFQLTLDCLEGPSGDLNKKIDSWCL
jgi:hypothetical protein